MKKILYVEDNEDNIFMLKMRLERKGFEVITAKDGQEGVNTARKILPDLILMDVGLPIMDGYKATQVLKEDELTKKIPIIILTAHATIEDRDRAISSGANDYETKPINIIKLTEKMHKIL